MCLRAMASHFILAVLLGEFSHERFVWGRDQLQLDPPVHLLPSQISKAKQRLGEGGNAPALAKRNCSGFAGTGLPPPRAGGPWAQTVARKESGRWEQL